MPSACMKAKMNRPVALPGPKKLSRLELDRGSSRSENDVTSNFAEYTALSEALKKLRVLGSEGDILVRSDSKLMVGQMSEGWKVKGGMYIGKLKEARDLVKEFGFIRFEWIPREQNQEANLLTRASYDRHRRWRPGPQPSVEDSEHSDA